MRSVRRLLLSLQSVIRVPRGRGVSARPHRRALSRAGTPVPLRALLALLVGTALGACADPVAAPAARRTPAPAPSALRVNVPATFAHISAGFLRTCDVTTTGAARCWGDNQFDATVVPPLPVGLTYTAIDAGNWHACALRSDGTIACWGSAAFGVGNPPSLPTGVTYTQIAVGFIHTCALRSDGAVSCWGNNNLGQTDVPTPPAGLTYTQITSGMHHACGLRSDGTVQCWGNNSSGQTQVPVLPRAATYTHIDAGDFTTCAVRSNGTAACWGMDNEGMLAVPASPAGVTYTRIAAGTAHACALRSDGTAVCWPSGAGSATVVPTLPAGVTYTSISTGGGHTCALRSDGTTICWGSNRGGISVVPPVQIVVLPTATFVAPASIPALQSVTLALTNAQVPGHPQATSFTYAFDCGTGTFGPASAANSASCSTTTPGTLTVRGRVIDVDGDAAEYTATVTVTKAPAAVALGALTQLFDGTPRVVTAATTPAGLPVTITYNGTSNAPTAVGSHAIAATVNSPLYEGSATGTLVVERARVAVQPAQISLTATGTVAAYVYGSALVDVATMDASKVRLRVVGGTSVGAPVAMRNGIPLTTVRDFDGDGRPDRMLTFLRTDLVAAGLAAARPALELTHLGAAPSFVASPVQAPSIVP